MILKLKGWRISFCCLSPLNIDDVVPMSERVRLGYLCRPFLKDGGAKYIVTHNTKDFEGVEERFEIKIVTPKQFLNLTKGLKS